MTGPFWGPSGHADALGVAHGARGPVTPRVTLWPRAPSVHAAPGCRPVWYRPRHEPTELGVCRAHLCQVRPAQQQDAPGWQDPGAAAQRRCVKPVSSSCRHGALPAWLARGYEGRSAYEWACNPRLGARSSMGGVAVPSPADKMQPVQRPGAAPWLARPWLVPCVPHV
jgi:hypothetical protein